VLFLLSLAVVPAPAVTASGTCTSTTQGSYTVQVCLTAPAAASTLTGGVAVTATASVTSGTGHVNELTFTMNGSNLITTFQTPFGFTWHTSHWIDGAYTLGVYADMSDGTKTSGNPASASVMLANGVTTTPTNTAQATITTGTAPAAGQPAVVAAVGSGASGESASQKVVNEIAGWSPNLFLYLGDVYENGTFEEFQNWYAPSWGTLRSLTNPTIGNDDTTPGGYAWYWNNEPSSYSYDAAGWHFISLNGNTPTSSTQQSWLNNDLASHPGACVIVSWHQPYFSLGGASSSEQGLWSTVANSHASLVLNGHSHTYQRWAAMDGSGNLSPTGTAEFVVGTGGRDPYGVSGTDSRVLYSQGNVTGALKLSLSSTAAGFQFLSTAGTVLDSGTIPCQGTGTLTGTVSDGSTGAALSGVNVAYSGTGPAGPVSGTATTNASGQYTVSGIAVTSYTVTASLANYATQSATVTVGGGKTAIQNFALQSNPGAVSGTVSDAGTAQPIGGALISDSVSGLTATTSSTGQYTLANLAEGSHSLSVTASGYVSQSKTVSVAAGSTTNQNFTLSLAPGGITGTISNAGNNQPIGGATVSDGAISTTTDATGRYTFSGVPPGTYTVTASATGFTTQSGSVTVNPGATTTQNFSLAAAGTCSITTQSGYTVQVCLSVPSAGSTLTGAITVTATATIMAGTVTVSGIAFTQNGTALLTAFASPYTFTWHTAHWVDGAYTLAAYAEMSDGSQTSGNPASEAVTLANGVSTVPTNSNHPTITTGTAPAAGQPEVVAAVGNGASGEPASTQVASEIGGWSPNLFLYLGDVYDGGTYEEFQNWYDPSWGQLRAITNPTSGNHETSADGYAWYWNNEPSYYSYDAAGWHFVELNGDDFSSAQLTWLNNDLSAHAGACTIAYWHEPLYSLNNSATPGEQNLWAAVAGAHTTLVLNGHVHIYQRWTAMNASGTPSPTGVVEIAAGTGGHDPQAVSGSDSRLMAAVGDLSGAVKLTLGVTSLGFQFVGTDGTVPDSGSLPCQGSGSITGTVTDTQTGQPVSGATVSYSGTGPAGVVSGTLLTNATGQYSVSGVAVTTYTVSAGAAGYGSQSANVTVGGARSVTQNFGLAPGPGSISGTVIDSVTSQPLNGAAVSYSGGSTSTNAAGQYSLSAVAEGTYQVTAHMNSYTDQVLGVTVGPSGSPTQNFTLAPNPGSITGTVTDAHTGLTLTGVTVSFSGGSTSTNAAGQYTFTGVTEGTYTVSATFGGYAGQTASVAVGPGAAMTQNVALPPNPGTLSGTVTDAQTGNAVSGATAGDGSGSATTDAAGHYSIAGVMEGTYTLTISATGYVGQSQSVTVGPGATVTTNAVLAPNPGSISGTVVDSSTSQGISGATLSTGSLSVTSGAGGQYAFPNLAEGTYTLTVTAPAYATQVVSVLVGPGATVTQTVALQPNPATISGLISDAVTGQPVSGATVSAAGAPGTATSDATGAYTLSSLASGTYLVSVTATNYASQSSSVTASSGVTSTQNFSLQPNAGSLGGTITDASTKLPIGGAAVSYAGGSVTTGANGIYSFGNVTEGSYTVSATAAGYASQSLTVSVGPGAAVTQNLALQPNPGVISGTVTDAVTNQIIFGAQVSSGSSATTTNSAGQYTLTGIPEGSAVVQASAAGYATLSQTVSVGPGASVTLNLAVQPNPGSITGTVTDGATGQPVSGAGVSDGGASTSTAASGLYTLAGVTEGSYTLTVTAAGYAAQTATVSVNPGAATTQNISLSPNPGSITGTISDARTAQPILGASVSDGATMTSTNAAGQYSFTGLAEGSYTISASAPNYAGQSQAAAVGAGAAVTQNIALQPNPGSITGNISDAVTNQAIANAAVTDGSASTSTDLSGQYTLSGIPEGSSTLSVAVANYATATVPVSVGAGASVTQNVALQPNPATISGTVLDASTNQPAPGATVTYSGGSANTDGSGLYTLRVTEGSYTLTASAPGYASQSASVTVGPAATLSQNFTLVPQPGSITGTVTDAVTGTPLSGATVTYSGGSATTSSAGQYAFSSVPEGSYTVSASAVNYAGQSQSASVKPGAAANANLALQPNPGAISGTVTSASTGLAIANATVSFVGGSAKTNASGQYTLGNVTEGTYSVTATSAGYVSQSQTVSLGPAGAVTQNFKLTVAQLFSDGFETGSFANWTSNSGLAVETAMVHAGVDAAEGNTTNGVTYAYKKLSSTYQGLYTRLYFDLKSQASGFTLVNDETGSGGAWIARLYINGSSQLCLWVNPSPFTCGPIVSLGAWHAAELHIIVNGTSGTTEVWLDGNPVAALSQTLNLGTTSVGAVRIGDAATGRTYDVIFDDVVVSLARIGL
jgi:hypothetical protein